MKFGIKSSKKLRGHSVQETVANELVEVRVDTRMKTDIKVQHNRPDIVVHDRRRNEITLNEVCITNQYILQTVEVEKRGNMLFWLDNFLSYINAKQKSYLML